MSVEAGTRVMNDATPDGRMFATGCSPKCPRRTGRWWRRIWKAITLKERQVVEVPNKPITHVYFVETGVVSVVAVNAEDHRIEVGVIGKEGMTGVPLVIGDDRAQHSAYMQIGGSGRRIAGGGFCAKP